MQYGLIPAIQIEVRIRIESGVQWRLSQEDIRYRKPQETCRFLTSQILPSYQSRFKPVRLAGRPDCINLGMQYVGVTSTKLKTIRLLQYQAIDLSLSPSVCLSVSLSLCLCFKTL